MISILYVDDEDSFLMLTKRYLEKSGTINVDTSVSAEIALQMLKSNKYDAVVSDYQMPGMDGIEFLTVFRKTYSSLPFIIFTGKGREEVAIEAFEKGADFYLQKGGDTKPMFAELVHKIQAAVDQRKADARTATMKRLYAVLSATDRAIVRIHDRNDLLVEICRILVDTGGFLMARVAMADPETNRIRRVAAYGKIDTDLDTATSAIDETDTGTGPTRTAFRERTYIVCNDIMQDPHMGPWQKDSMKRGYGSMAAFPFASGTPGAGVFTLYASETGFFDNEIVPLLEEVSQSITFALRAMQKEEDERRLLHELQVHQVELSQQNEELRRSRDEVEAGLKRFSDFYDFAPAGFFTLAKDGTIRRVNLTGAGLLAVDRSHLVNRRFNLFVHEDNRPAFHEFLQRIFQGHKKERCGIRLKSDNSAPVPVRIDAALSSSGQDCILVVVDMTPPPGQVYPAVTTTGEPGSREIIQPEKINRTQ